MFWNGFDFRYTFFKRVLFLILEIILLNVHTLNSYQTYLDFSVNKNMQKNHCRHELANNCSVLVQLLHDHRKTGISFETVLEQLFVADYRCFIKVKFIENLEAL